jgi:alpha-L-fucosidase
MANHHDGFDCWNSSFQPWNSVNLGPKRDIIGTWADAARQRGLRFGVAVFSTQNWQWFNVSHGSDRTGPLKEVPYDGNLTKADSAGQWWNGYDPQLLYGPPHIDDEPPPGRYVQNFFNRTKELIDKYRPDQVFFTDNGLPLGDTGLRLAAHFYNANRQWHGGNDEAVINTKNVAPDLVRALVWDRLPPEEILPFAWQMDICIGDWHYKRDLAYRPAADVVPYLVDVVSKNGNLLLNIPIRADGSIDRREIDVLDQITSWMKVNGEAIFDTRPWKVFGEGPIHAPAVDFPYVRVRYTPQDIRFTAKGTTLYAIALAWPDDGVLEIKSMGRLAPQLAGEIAGIEMLGSDVPLKWTREESGLVITLPEKRACNFAHAFRIHIG